MPRALPPIPSNTPIADPKDGSITTFFRLRWQQLVDGWAQSGSVSTVSVPARTAQLTAMSVFTVISSGDYRVTWYLRKTRADGAVSNLIVTIGFVDLDSQPLTYAGPGLTLDTMGAWQSETKQIRCINSSDITVAVGYNSGTPGQMRYDLVVKVEALA